jgi:S-adenosylmethionine-diacylglycerol 3-amino-3-carboxypropyl transferase
MEFDAALNKLKDKLFSKIHQNNLVYNTCWEDPRIDRQLMNINAESKILMITSAGCNALDYLLDNPSQIDCIDVNSKQNALLELKKAAIKKLEFEDFFQFFGEGNHPLYNQLFKIKLRPELPEYAQQFWDRKIKYFSPGNGKKSFYFRGTSGQFAWLFNKYLNTKKKVKLAAEAILEAENLQEQRDLFSKIEPYILKPFVKWLMNRHFTMTLLGVPRSQQDLITNKYPGGMSGYLTDNLRHIFMDLPMEENYFWRLYITGKYTRSCCPSYLKIENFYTLKERIQNLNTHTNTISNFLKENPNAYSHYVLLDHQDWLAANNVEALKEEWIQIFKNSKLGTKVLMRSASTEIDFLPDFVKSQLDFYPMLTDELHQKDRVGTYGSTYFGKVVKVLGDKYKNEIPNLEFA